MTESARATLWFQKLAAIAASVLLAVLCVELLTRATGQDRPLAWRPDPRLGWWHIPGAKLHWTDEGNGWVEINTLGMRDVERTVAKPAGVFRIAVFGDSMTEGVQVNLDQTFTQQLEKRLRQRGLRVEVLNFGVSGYSPLQGYLTYKSIGKAFAPDLVLHAVYTDNDIADCDPELAAGQVGAPFVNTIEPGQKELTVDYSRAEESARDYDREPLYTLRRWFATYRMLGAIRRTYSGAGQFRATAASTGGIPRRYLVYLDPTPPKWAAAWSTFERVLDAFAADAKSAGSRFAVISVPAGHVVDEQVWNHVVSEYPPMASRGWQLLGPEERLRSIAVQHGVPVIEALEEFRKRLSDSGQAMFFGGNGHMTPLGHEVMAGVLDRYLESHGFLPAQSAQKVRN